MIELYRPPECPTCAEIEEALQAMVLAHKVIVVEPDQRSEALEPDTSLPALKDNGQTFTGQAEIRAHLEELERIAYEWRKYQADACYVDEETGLPCF